MYPTVHLTQSILLENLSFSFFFEDKQFIFTCLIHPPHLSIYSIPSLFACKHTSILITL